MPVEHCKQMMSHRLQTSVAATPTQAQFVSDVKLGTAARDVKIKHAEPTPHVGGRDGQARTSVAVMPAHAPAPSRAGRLSLPSRSANARLSTSYEYSCVAL